MHRPPTPRLRRLSAALLLLPALLGTGCIPGVAWLPDSSGFVYTAGKDCTRLVHYDLAAGRPRVLVEDTGAPTNWPAVSPDGKRIAVAHWIPKEKGRQTTLQLLFYDRAGKEVKRSKVLSWAEAKNPGRPNPNKRPDILDLPQLFWAPRGDRILVTTPGYAALYEIKADRLTRAGPGLVLVFGGSPVRPDGAGFLVMKNVEWSQWWSKKAGTADPDPHFAFVDWQGKERALKPPALLLDAEALHKEKDANKLGALLWPGLYQSAWRGDVAEVSWLADRLRYRTGKGEAVLDRIPPATTADGLPIKQRYDFPGGKVHLRVVFTKKAGQPAPRGGALRVEVVKAGGQRPEVLLDQTEVCLLVPAPNGRLVALRSFRDQGPDRPPADQILVVNDQGQVVARPGGER